MRIEDHRLQSPGLFTTKVRHVTTRKMGGKISPEFIVWHFTVGSARSAINAFTTGSRNASAHLVIGRNGSVTQVVPFNRRAWHAGRSTWEGKPGCNGFTIGIELENIGPLLFGGGVFRDVYGRKYTGGVVEEKVGRYSYWSSYTARQIETSFSVAELLLDHYPKIRGMLEHSDISPGRKIDSGPAFPIEKLEGMVDDRGHRDTDDPDLYRTTTRLNVRDSAGMSGKLIGTLDHEARVIPKSAIGSWWLVKATESKLEGWVYSKYLVAF